MKKVQNIYYYLKEVFGPNISIEILDISNEANITHFIGDDIYETTKNRTHLSIDEIKKILKDKTNLNSLPWQLVTIQPGDILEKSFSAPVHTLIHFDQFSSFSRVIKFVNNGKTYALVIISTLLDDGINENIFREYWGKIKNYLDGQRINVTREYLKTKVPSFLNSQFYILQDILTKISLSKVENKQLHSGLLFVDNYENFKRDYYSDLFLDINCKYTVREVDKIKQPFLEIVDGNKSFLVADRTFSIKGIFFPDKTPKGLGIIETDDKKLLSECLVVKIEGSNLVRVAVKNKMIYEIQNGLVRIRDYNALKNIFNNILDDLGITNNRDELLTNIIDISFLKKGTIIILGERIDGSKYTKGVKGEVDLQIVRNTVPVYKQSILTQLSKTDGAIFVDNDFKVYCFGAILKINNTNDNSEIGGGSRTHSARVFSSENENVLVIKISEDGPISLFYKGELKLEV